MTHLIINPFKKCFDLQSDEHIEMKNEYHIYRQSIELVRQTKRKTITSRQDKTSKGKTKQVGARQKGRGKDK